MGDILQGQLISLRPLRPDERDIFFQWATDSDATPFWYGELYGDQIPSSIVFDLEWPDYYLDGSQPHKGRCFAILLEGEPIGQINYNEIDLQSHMVELDIIIANRKHHGKGYGTEAIQLLTNYLFQHMNVLRCKIEVVSANPRAFHASSKAGYHHSFSYSRRGIHWHVLERVPQFVME